MNLFSAYDYLSFIIPGGVVLAAWQRAFWGWPPPEPGAAGLALILAVSFLAGHLLATVAAWLQPVAWRRRPGSSVDPLAGVFNGPTASHERERLAVEMSSHYGSAHDNPTLYGLAYTDVQLDGRSKDRLNSLNAQIGFSRSAAVAFGLGAVIQASAAIIDGLTVETLVIEVGYVLAAALFVFRFKRTWSLFGSNVVRTFRVLRAHPPRAVNALHRDRSPSCTSSNGEGSADDRESDENCGDHREV